MTITQVTFSFVSAKKSSTPGNLTIIKYIFNNILNSKEKLYITSIWTEAGGSYNVTNAITYKDIVSAIVINAGTKYNPGTDGEWKLLTGNLQNQLNSSSGNRIFKAGETIDFTRKSLTDISVNIKTHNNTFLPPILTTVSIKSNGPIRQIAKTGNTITLEVVVNKDINSIVFFFVIGEKAVKPTVTGSKKNWKATYVVQSTDTGSVIPEILYGDKFQYLVTKTTDNSFVNVNPSTNQPNQIEKAPIITTLSKNKAKNNNVIEGQFMTLVILEEECNCDCKC